MCEEGAVHDSADNIEAELARGGVAAREGDAQLGVLEHVQSGQPAPQLARHLRTGEGEGGGVRSGTEGSRRGCAA